MIKIEFPEYQPKIKKQDGADLIFDTFRKCWVKLTPEEWVRQNFLNYLVKYKKYPASLIAVEKEIKLGDLKKRFDIVVYDTGTKPWTITECKEMKVKLDEKVLKQALIYNSVLKLPYLVITNGSFTTGFYMHNGSMTELEFLPEF
jgi:hypothetical protein